MKKPCRIKRHMTVSRLEGVDTLIFNYSCIPHGIWRKAFRSFKGREQNIHEHSAKKKKVN